MLVDTSEHSPLFESSVLSVYSSLLKSVVPTMITNQVYLLLGLLASEGKTLQLKSLTDRIANFVYFKTKEIEELSKQGYPHDRILDLTLYKVTSLLLVFLPDHLDPHLLTFILDLMDRYTPEDVVVNDDIYGTKLELELEEILEQFQASHPNYQTYLNLDPSTISNRATKLCQQVTKKSMALSYSSSLDPTKLTVSFIKARTIKVNEVIPDLTFNFPLFVVELSDWRISYVQVAHKLFPYLSPDMTLSKWNTLTIKTQLKLIYDCMTENSAERVTHEILIPYITYINCWSEYIEYLQTVFELTIQDSQLLSSNLSKLKTNDFEVLKVFQQNDCNCYNRLVSLVIAAGYLTPSVDLNLCLMFKEILSFILNVSDDDTVSASPTDRTIELNDWKDKGLSEVIEFPTMVPTKNNIIKLRTLLECCEKLYASNLSVFQLLNLQSTSDSQIQLLELNKFLANEIQYCSSERDWISLLNTLNWFLNDTQIFSQVSKEEVNILFFKLFFSQSHNYHALFRIIVPQLVGLQEFNKNPRYASIILEHAWSLYGAASNINHLQALLSHLHDPSIVTDPDIIPKNTNSVSQTSQLQSLISAFESISQRFHLSFSRNFQPKNLLLLNNGEDPIHVIVRILESEESSYKDPEYLVDIYENLIIGFSDSSESGQLLKTQFGDLQILVQLKCIEFSLVRNNFNYAYQNGLELLDSRSSIIQQNWLVFFQISKYIDDDSSENSKSLIEKQLSILGKLLLHVPTEFNVPIVEQWSLLNKDLERIKRDLKLRNRKEIRESNAKANESLESRFTRALTSSATEVLKNQTAQNLKVDLGQAQDKFSNMLVNGLGWAIGATPNNR
ncbi:BA75_02737T0 [Komagataella pastoris]|uniref:BA75_02737T0 n=1 Tax=Komagataella pastoris TaxID=4922 RepID=A0A1B2JDV1_PICPA|nr:BA75_02737T0 [Komagataella pastoris]